jgi:RNA-directed DNA polymerase
VRRESHARFYERLAVKFRRPTHPFGPQRFRKDGHWYLGARPSKKSVARLRRKVGEVLVPGNKGTWLEVRDRLNSILRGWSSYFRYGTRLQAYRAVDNHVAERARHFLKQRHHVRTRGTRPWTNDTVFGPLGVLRLRTVHVGVRP